MNVFRPANLPDEDDVWPDLAWMDSLRQNGKTRLVAAQFGVDIDGDVPDCTEECACGTPDSSSGPCHLP